MCALKGAFAICTAKWPLAGRCLRLMDTFGRDRSINRGSAISAFEGRRQCPFRGASQMKNDELWVPNETIQKHKPIFCDARASRLNAKWPCSACLHVNFPFPSQSLICCAHWPVEAAKASWDILDYRIIDSTGRPIRSLFVSINSSGPVQPLACLAIIVNSCQLNYDFKQLRRQHDLPFEGGGFVLSI